MNRMIKTALALLLLLSTLLSFTSCALFAEKVSAVDLMDGYEQSKRVKADAEPCAEAVDFALRMLSASADGENVMISPYSIISALALTMNGAKGETLAGMEEALGFTLDELNAYLPSYAASLKSGEKSKLTTANSIWFRDDGTFRVEPSFLQTNADLYDADAYAAPFDETTLRDINGWISDKTDGIIENMLDSIPSNAVTYLVNAVLFDAEWEEPYLISQLGDGKFTNADGTEKNAVFMCDQGGRGFELDGAVGLVRPYFGGDYEFAAILPDEGTTPSDYLRSLDASAFMSALSCEMTTADTSIPKFEMETKAEISEILADMGMKDACDADKADFSGIGSSDLGNIYISSVLHNTKIELNERGTKAGAATVIEMATGAMPAEPELTVRLDRPFLFFICDAATHTPIFCGMVCEL